MLLDLKQVVPGSINISPNAIRCVSLHGQTFIGCCSSNKVTIFSKNLSVVQTLQHDEEIVCLEWCENPDGKLAVAFGSVVVIYILTTINVTDNVFVWSKFCTISHDVPVLSISWQADGECILVGGDALVLWKIGRREEVTNKTILESESIKKEKEAKLKQQLWRTTTTIPTRYCSFSPDGKYFATLGDYDRFVKVWYKYREGLFRFIYLPHPRAIVNLNWRRKSQEHHSNERNVLLTVSRTNVVWLWIEASQGERFHFNVATIIEPGLGSVVDWLNSSISNNMPSDPDDDVPIRKAPSLLPITPSTQSSVDWIVTVQKTGMVIIWKVKGLMQQSKRTPSSSIWSRFSIPATPGSHLKMIALCNIFSADERSHPLRFRLYILSLAGSITLWDCSVEGEPNPKISAALTSTCFGHKSMITSSIVHPTLPLVATTDQTQRTILWRSNEPKLADPPFSFILGNLSILDTAPVFAWTPSGTCVLTSNSRGVFVYEVELSDSKAASSNNANVNLLGLLSDSDRFCPLNFLHVFDDQEQNLWCIVGIPDNGEHIVFWTMAKPKRGQSSLQIGTFITAHAIAPEARLSCAVSAVSLFSSGEKTPFSLMTGGSDGILRLWKLNAANGDSSVEQVSSTRVYAQPFESLRCGSYSYFASTAENLSEIHIWRLESSTEITLEHTVELGPKNSPATPQTTPLTSRSLANSTQSTPNLRFSSTGQTSGQTAFPMSGISQVSSSVAEPSPICFDWLSLADGNNVFAFAKGTDITLLNRKWKSDYHSYGAEWSEVKLQSISYPVESLVWTSDGTLVASASNQLFVFSKWINEKERVAEDHPTLFHLSTSLYRPLHFYHPRMIAQYLISGHFNKAATILKHLYKFLEEEEDKASGSALSIKQVPPLILETLTADIEKKKQKVEPIKSEDVYSFLDTSKPTVVENEEDEPATEEIFTGRQAKRLAEMLTATQLPYVARTETLLLLAVIETFSQMRETQGAIDESGARFLLSFRIFSFLKRSLPPNERPTTLSSFDFAWALQSEAEANLLQTCLPSDATWPAAREIGVGLWLRNPTLLKSVVERMAKAQFTAKKDPQDCALFYIALNKKPALVALFKAVNNMTVYNFLKNDFSETKYITSALANAYQLMSKQRFELAAAFFLLGGKLKDAVGVCIQKLGDFQLALMIARLVEGEGGEVYQSILLTNILPHATQTGDSSLASISYWLLKRYSDSLAALVPSRTSAEDTSLDTKKKESEASDRFDPSVLHLFDTLKNHTMLRNTQLNIEDLRFDLMKKSAYSYVDTGYTLLALEQIRELKDILKKSKAAQAPVSSFSFGSAMGRFGARKPAATPAATSRLSKDKSLDSTFLYKVALQLESQEVTTTDTTSPLGASAATVKQNLEFVSTLLEINQQILLQELLRFCEIRQHFRAQYDLFYGSQESLNMLLLSNSLHISSLAKFNSPPSLTYLQSLSLLNVSRQLYQGLNVGAKSSLSAPEQSDVIRSIEFGIFLFLLRGVQEKKFHALYLLLTGKNMSEVLAAIQKEERNREDGKQEEDDAKVSRKPKGSTLEGIEIDAQVRYFLDNLLSLLIMRKFLAHLETSAKHSTSAASEIAKSLVRWTFEAQMELSSLPNNIGKSAKKTNVAINNKAYLSLFSEFMKNTPEYQNDDDFTSLWDCLAADEQLVSYIADMTFKNNYLSEPDEHEPLKFTETVIVYKDRDILQSFCINSKDPNQIAMATTRGIREVTLDNTKKILFSEEHEDDHHGPSGLSATTGGDFFDKESPRFRTNMNRSDSQLSLSPFNSATSTPKTPGHRKSQSLMPPTSLISKQIDHNILVQWLESHPIYPYYLSGGIDGSICLWQFNAAKDSGLMATYVLAPNPRVTRIHFNKRGTKFGACDMSGKLSLWRFDASEASLRPYQILNCHSKSTLDFTFINSGSLIATAGISTDKKNLCIWDTLMPPDKAMVSSFTCHDGGASSLIYSARHQLLISGGKKGEIVVFDIRQQKELETIRAHQMNVKSLDLDPTEDFFLSGSNEGNVKAWDLPSLTCRETWDDVHSKHTFVRKPGVFAAPVSTYGVMQVMLTWKHMYTCGSDGRILKTTFLKDKAKHL